jgi:TetR/AcrR family transcriptional regulator, repressor for uid operon
MTPDAATMDVDAIDTQSVDVHSQQHGSAGGNRLLRREAQVTRIVDAARRCFLRSGFHGASMGDICSEAGMSPGALYRYFASKESLIEAICAADREEDAKILMLITAAPSIVDGMTESMLAHVRHMSASGLAALYSEIFAEAQRNAAIGNALERSMCDVETAIIDALFKAHARGEIDPVAPIPVLMQIMLAMGHGIVTHDLPRLGITPDMMEPVIRAMVVGLLRPREKTPAAEPEPLRSHAGAHVKNEIRLPR